MSSYSTHCDSLCCVCNRPYIADSRREQLIPCKQVGCRVMVHRECSGLGIERYDFVRMCKEFALNHGQFDFTCPKCFTPPEDTQPPAVLERAQTQPARVTGRGRGRSRGIV